MGKTRYITYRQAESVLKEYYMKGDPLDAFRLYDVLKNSSLHTSPYIDTDDDWGACSDEEFLEKLNAMTIILQDPYAVADSKVSHLSEDAAFGVQKGYSTIMMYRQYNYLYEVMHSHDYIEIYYVMHGRIEVDFEGNSLELTDGDMLFIAAGAMHSLRSVSDKNIILDMSVRTSSFEKMFIKQLSYDTVLSTFFRKIIYEGTDLKYTLFHTRKDGQIKSAIKNITMETYRQGEFFDIMYTSWANIIFSTLLRRYYADVESDPPIDNNEFSQILRYITEHYDTVTLDALSMHFNYSRPHICNLIKTNTGRTLTELVNAQKLKRAEILLGNTDYSIEEIASLIGFTSTDYFTRLFRRNYGITPGKFRKAAQRSTG